MYHKAMARSTALHEAFPRVSIGKLLLSFAFGVLLGIVLVFNIIRGHLALALPSVGSLGAIGTVLLIAVFLMFVITVGVISLYLLFAMIDN